MRALHRHRVGIALLSLALVLASCGPTQQPNASGDVIITYDEGGNVVNYATYYKNLPKGARVVIDGWCASSCTIALALPNTCVTDRGYLGFHLAYGTGSEADNKQLSDYLWSQYPPGIKKWISDRGGLTTDIKQLEGAELHALVKHC